MLRAGVVWEVRSEADTAALALALAGWVRGGQAVGLCGGLGAGKTAFVRHLVAALGGDSEEVASPTYTLQHWYTTAARAPQLAAIAVQHWDLYRVFSVPEELQSRPSVGEVWVIEWPERCPELLDQLDVVIDFTITAPECRRVAVAGRCADEVAAAWSSVVAAGGDGE